METIISRVGLAVRRASAGGISAIMGLGSSVLVLGSATPAQACGSDSYIGSVCAFAFNWCPNNWLPADGRQVAINGNQALFSLISTQYGGSQQSGQFNLPDLRGRAIVHSGTGTGLPPQAFATQSGAATSTLTTTNLAPHNHGATFTGTGAGTQTINVPATAGTLDVTAKTTQRMRLASQHSTPIRIWAKPPHRACRLQHLCAIDQHGI